MRTSSKPWYWKARKAFYVQINGKQVKLSADRAEAKRKWHQLLAAGKLPKDKKLQDCIDHYLPTVSVKSQPSRRKLLAQFAKHAGGTTKVSKLTKKTVRSFCNKDWSPSTTRSAIKTILACLNRCVKDRLIDANPVGDIEKPAWERREKILTGEELTALLSHAREPFKTLLVAMAESGCRPQEVCGLQIADVFLEDQVWLVENKTKNQTGMKKRPVYLTEPLVEITKKAIGDRTEGHVFLNRYGDPWTTDTVRLRFSRLRDKLGLSEGVIPYGTRHRFASDAINQQKMDSLIVARLLGHSDARMLQKTYFREESEPMREAMRRARQGR